MKNKTKHTWAKGLAQGHSQVSSSDSDQVYVDREQCSVPTKGRYFPYFKDLQFITHKGLYEVLMQLYYSSADNFRQNIFSGIYFCSMKTQLPFT